MTCADQKFYDRMIADGVSPKLAEMFATQTAPGCVTDSTFLRGTENGRQFQGQEKTAEAYRKVAAKAGVNVKGKKYLSGLAAYPGDPRAWVSGRGDVQKVCEERGWSCDGSVKVKMREPDAPPAESPPLAEDIVQRYVAAELASDPAPVTQRRVLDAREKVIAKHGRKKRA